MLYTDIAEKICGYMYLNADNVTQYRTRNNIDNSIKKLLTFCPALYVHKGDTLFPEMFAVKITNSGIDNTIERLSECHNTLIINNIYGTVEMNEWIETFSSILGFTKMDVDYLLISSAGHRCAAFYNEVDNNILVLTNRISDDVLYHAHIATERILEEVYGSNDAIDSEIHQELIDIKYCERMLDITVDEVPELLRAIDELYNKYANKKEAAEKLKAIMNSLDDVKKYMNDITVGRIRSEINNASSRRDALLSELRDVSTTLRDLQMKKLQKLDTSLIEDCITSAVENGHLIDLSISDNYLCLTMCSELFGYADDGVEYLYDTACDYGIPPEFIKTVFEDRKYVLRINQKVGLDFTHCMYAAYNTTHCFNAIQHPHLAGYNCWGDNAHLIIDALARNDIISAVAIIQSIISQINLIDTPVVEKMFYYITCDKFATAFRNTSTNELVSYNTIMQEIENNKKAEVELNEEDETE